MRRGCIAVRICLLFFFQAEDGIRDLVRSRGLGDVYKRQHQMDASVETVGDEESEVADVPSVDGLWRKGRAAPVSYTHLTLPTSDLV